MAEGPALISDRLPVPRLCVFCGSRVGVRPSYLAAARELGSALARRRLGLVYGGASVGLMGALADAVLADAGEVIGVIPQGVFTREVAHTALTELHVVPSMHARKALMAQKSDAFLALPGGLGTFDELFEILTWKQIGLHAKPIGLLDVDGYFGALGGMLEQAVVEGFSEPVPIAVVDSSVERVLDVLLGERPRQ